VVAAGEVLKLHKALIDESLQAMVQTPKTQARTIGQGTLADVRLLVQDAQHSKGVVFLNLRLAGGRLDGERLDLDTLPPYQAVFLTNDGHRDEFTLSQMSKVEQC
jgi:hypothetical protein